MNYNKKTVKDVDVRGKKVLLRCDFNVPLAKDGSGTITDEKRIVAALPTIRYLLEEGAAVIACSHLGKPEPDFDKWVKKQTEKGKDPAALTEEKWKKSLDGLRMEPVAKRLSQLLGQPVLLADDVVGPDAKAKAAALQPGQVMLLQNTRFEQGETKNDPDLSKAMAGMADVSRYCAVRAMDREEALAALASGEATAVLELPEGFVRKVQWGENPPVRIIVDGSRPLAEEDRAAAEAARLAPRAIVLRNKCDLPPAADTAELTELGPVSCWNSSAPIASLLPPRVV